MEAKGTILITNAQIVNEGQINALDVFVKHGFIEQIGPNLSHLQADVIINGTGKYLLPGIIDDQVHFREPGLTHKASIASESMAAIAGGVTTFMEMPNTVPPTLTQELLANKFEIASTHSVANYSFFMGVSNTNSDEVLRTNPKDVCGIKIFLGSSTGDMLVDNQETLFRIFKESGMLIAIHSEDEKIIKANQQQAIEKYGQDVPLSEHPNIRSVEACLNSTIRAINLAKELNTRLHVLHISTAEETALFVNNIPLEQKRITAEVCVHHLHFTSDDYAHWGNLIKCNPAIKVLYHREALWKALLNNQLDIIATDHAPHTWAEKQQSYLKAPSGLPLVQHSLPLMLQAVSEGKLTLETLVQKMAHNPAICFKIEKRGFIREGYWADLVLVDMEETTNIRTDNVLYRCGWSPLLGSKFMGKVSHTIVSGVLAYEDGIVNTECRGHRLRFGL